MGPLRLFSSLLHGAPRGQWVSLLRGLTSKVYRPQIPVILSLGSAMLLFYFQFFSFSFFHLPRRFLCSCPARTGSLFFFFSNIFYLQFNFSYGIKRNLITGFSAGDEMQLLAENYFFNSIFVVSTCCQTIEAILNRQSDNRSKYKRE